MSIPVFLNWGGGAPPCSPGGHEAFTGVSLARPKLDSQARFSASLRVYVKSGSDVDLLRGYVASSAVCWTFLVNEGGHGVEV